MSVEASDLEELATAPASVSTDAGSFSERSADDVIKIDQYAQQKRASASKSRGLRFNKLTFGSNAGGNFGGDL